MNLFSICVKCLSVKYICVGVFGYLTKMQILTVQTNAAVVSVHTSTATCLLLSTLKKALAFSLSTWKKFSLMLMGDNMSSTHFCKKNKHHLYVLSKSKNIKIVRLT